MTNSWAPAHTNTYNILPTQGIRQHFTNEKQGHVRYSHTKYQCPLPIHYDASLIVQGQPSNSSIIMVSGQECSITSEGAPCWLPCLLYSAILISTTISYHPYTSKERRVLFSRLFGKYNCLTNCLIKCYISSCS